MIVYLVSGLNQKRFLDSLGEAGIFLRLVEVLSHNQIKIGIEKKDKKNFFALAKKYNYDVQELSIQKGEKFVRLVKKNIAFFVCSIVILFMLPIFSIFVYKTEIYGLNSVSQSEVREVLNNSGYSMGKPRYFYDLDSLQNVLVSSIDKISLASAIITGNTLVVNVHEKIDNSAYLYDYQPILAPIDCVIESVNLISGTPNKNARDSARQGDVIVSPFVLSQSGQQLPVPAKAEIMAKFDISSTVFVSQLESIDGAKKIVEENKKKLYNKLSNLNILGEIQEKNMENDAKYGKYYTTILSGEIIF